MRIHIPDVIKTLDRQNVGHVETLHQFEIAFEHLFVPILEFKQYVLILDSEVQFYVSEVLRLVEEILVEVVGYVFELLPECPTLSTRIGVEGVGLFHALGTC